MIHLLVGLPGSGKTTWARRKQEEEGIPIVSRDDIRKMIYGVEFDIDNESNVDALFWAILHKIVAREAEVIVDATNLTKRARALYKELPGHHRITVHYFDIDTITAWKRKVVTGSKMQYTDFERLKYSLEPIQESEGFYKIVYHRGHNA